MRYINSKKFSKAKKERAKMEKEPKKVLTPPPNINNIKHLRESSTSDVIMEDGLLSLKWNNHKTTFFDILRDLREKANYTDATIAVEGKFYPVHKLVMSTCSQYFCDIFERTPCKSPVIVLKDVRSQDMDALLDYMYLGEVNVNQNDLPSLLKTAECLRIKGLAVPDEDPTKSKKQHHPDDRRESPPPKRRRHEDPPSTSQTARASSPPPNSPSRNSSTSGGAGDRGGGGHRAPSSSGGHGRDSSLDSSIDPPQPLVKVEMEESDDLEDGYRRDNNYEGSSINEGEGGDYCSEVSKSEHDPDNYGGGSYAGPSLQQGGDNLWEEGDSTSFPPEGFSGDHPGGQQPQGGEEGLGMGVVSKMGLVQVALAAHGLHPLEEGEVDDTEMNRILHDMDLNPHDVTGTPQYHCKFCEKSFFYPSSLEKHTRTHTGEKPFKCPQCSYSASQKSHVKTHIQRRHKWSPYRY